MFSEHDILKYVVVWRSMVNTIGIWDFPPGKWWHKKFDRFGGTRIYFNCVR